MRLTWVGAPRGWIATAIMCWTFSVFGSPKFLESSSYLPGWPRYQWQEDEPIPATGLPNPFDLEDSESARRAGLLHALHYPVEVTGALLPLEAISRFVEADSRNLLRKVFEEVFQGFTRFHSMDEVQEWMGLHAYPEEEGDGAYYVPFLNGRRPKHRMGFTAIEVAGRTRKPVKAFTFSCAVCHSANLFGRRVIGMTNRFPRANEVFIRGMKATQFIVPRLFDIGVGASRDEVRLYEFTRENLKSVEPKRPAQLGLDTSLAHTALSLSRRAPDEDATKSSRFERQPRPDDIRFSTPDSKPAVWWNVKYKNKWLLDGSVVSGNPIFTNILWNEIGRGTDLVELKRWLSENNDVIRELTTAVYASEAPVITDFFSPDRIDLESAQRGEKLYRRSCQKCHGEYVKGWSLPPEELAATGLPLKVAQLRTVQVIYFENTPIKDVGTDPVRRESMRSLLQLNNLRIHKENGIRVKVQHGYVPPPLVGIWARYPYLHNNSIPTLCDLLTPEVQRPMEYWARPAENQERDFDFDCNGYPRGRRPDLGREYLYKAGAPGLSNRGHDENILTRNGRELFTPQQKRDLIRFLQTL